IKTVRIRAGELRGIVQEQLLFLWKFAGKDTLAQGATLEIERVPIKAKCQSCDHVFMVQNHEFICSECDSKDVDVVEGKELDVLEIEVE
ncbi:MAG: hydrogenase maturation nickel metallochaperone HypA, partial [Gammaproteobacteria bacterium]|nr:hydrogenase maturation nickel metallochaperone HypA [Gammaproteobacteria bacterium]